jgi:galactose mutarotase-like enzyme
MIRLQNGSVTALLNPAGAELCSLYSSETGLEYIWQAGKEWPKHSPVLFPVVGSLKDGFCMHHDRKISLNRHGFAREKVFRVTEVNDVSVTFHIFSDDEILNIYPFPFELEITYHLLETGIEVIYIVKNAGNAVMYFSIGAHPAFRVPLAGGNFEDYYLEFEAGEDAPVWPLKEGLLAATPIPFLSGNRINLSHQLFEKDALVFKNLRSERISIKNTNNEHGLDIHFRKYPFFGIWSAKNADFVCLEPWHGITDSVNADQQLAHKDGIVLLDEGKIFTCSWSLTVY